MFSFPDHRFSPCAQSQRSRAVSPKTWLLAIAGALLMQSGAVSAQLAERFPGIGRAATPAEIAAWDIDVRPDFKGLPPGSGSVAQGMDVWEAKCASCHGVFGESNEVFSPLVGGTTRKDVETGRVARLTDPGFPGRTTMMKLSNVSTLWDYINRAMPWNAPKSLKTDEVYAVTAYLLNLAEVVPENFTLSDTNIREVQGKLPNRNGMTLDHGLWPGRGIGNGGKPDVRAIACMKNCAGESKLASFLPDHARNAHGNLAEQSRPVGGQVGIDTTKPAGTAPARAMALVASASQPSGGPGAARAGGGSEFEAVRALLSKNNCLACHAVDRKVLGPSLADVAKKYANRGDAAAYLTERILKGGSGIWGAVPMPAQSLPQAEAESIARWIAAGAVHK